MAIEVNYGPTPGLLGGMMYGAGRNEENDKRLQQLLQMLAQIRGQNQNYELEKDRMSLQERLARMNGPTVSSKFTPSAGSFGGFYSQIAPNTNRKRLHPLSAYYYE